MSGEMTALDRVAICTLVDLAGSERADKVSEQLQLVGGPHATSKRVQTCSGRQCRKNSLTATRLCSKRVAQQLCLLMHAS